MTWKIFPARILGNLIDKISEYRTTRKKEEAELNAEFVVHMRKHCYLDSLQFALGMIVNNENITVNDDKRKGYSIIIDGKKIFSGRDTEYTRPNMLINLESKSIDDMTLTFIDQYIGNPAQIFNLKTVDDYRLARNSIYNYITQGQGNWILNKDKNINT